MFQHGLLSSLAPLSKRTLNDIATRKQDNLSASLSSTLSVRRHSAAANGIALILRTGLSCGCRNAVLRRAAGFRRYLRSRAWRAPYRKPAAKTDRAANPAARGVPLRSPQMDPARVGQREREAQNRPG